MKKMFGFILFWIAVGMLLMLFIRNWLLAFVIMIIFLVLGYHLFCN